ncbi:hypothetical protein JW960_12615 [candidate division KSB1 bacterium]|nr:hypothetical protein [candidate division KSB1 bacterium]
MQIFRTSLIFIMLLFLAISGFAQSGYIIPQQRMIQIQPIFQNWTMDDTLFHEMSIPIYFYYPINRIMSVNLQTNQASASGNKDESLSGITDIQIGYNYYWEKYNLVFNVGINLPSGKKELTALEFNSSVKLSQNQYNFRVPNFGQGFNFAPGVTWAYTMNDELVLGAGMSFQYKGGFKPAVMYTEPYQPGSEFLLTGGVDYKLSPTAAVSADMIFITYGTDKVGGTEVFASGNMVITNFQLRKYFGYDEIYIFARYRTKGKNEALGISISTPKQAEATITYRKRMSQALSLGFVVEMRGFSPSDVSNGVDVRSLGLAPQYVVSPKLTVPMKIRYMQASFRDTGQVVTGYEIGIGAQYAF